jgi:hypothetical protein
VKSRVVRSREGDPKRWMQATKEPLDQNLHVVLHLGVRGLKEFLFDYRIHEVSSAEGSCEHVSHLSGGDRVVNRWCKKKNPKKGGSVRQVVETRHLGRSQPIIDLSCFGVSQMRRMRVQHCN